MLNKLTAQKKIRGEDQYSPGGRTRHAARPRDHRLLATARARRSRACRSCSAASRRRCGASRTTTTGRDTVRRSILLDAKADLLVFGMGERPVWEIARAARRAARRIEQLRDMRGTALRDDEAASAERSRPIRRSASRDGKRARAAVVRGGARRQAARSRTMSRAFQSRPTRTTRGRSAARTATRRVYFNPPRCRSTTARDGRALRSAVHARAAPGLRRRARSRRSRR